MKSQHAKKHKHKFPVEKCIAALLDNVALIRQQVWENPARCFEEIQMDSQAKSATILDVVAESNLCAALREALHGLNPLLLSEESLREARTSPHDGVAVLVDALDGTTLIQHGWDSWCAAATVWHPSSGAILAAFVAEANGTCHYATSNECGKAIRHRGRLITRSWTARGANSHGGAEAIAFYGYRRNRFDFVGSSLPPNEGSVFTIGGNPALVRMVDGFRRVDAVVEPIGQFPHDIVPGLYLCQRAGVTLIDASGRDLRPESLLAGELHRKIPFVAAWDPELAKRLLGSGLTLSQAA